MDRNAAVDSVVRALRQVNIQGSLFGQTVAIRLGLSESDVEALEVLIDNGAATAGRLARAGSGALSNWGSWRKSISRSLCSGTSPET